MGKSVPPATQRAQGGFGFRVNTGEGQQQALVPPLCPQLQPGSPGVRLTVLGSLRSPWARGVSHGSGAPQSGQDPGPGVHPWWLGWGGCGRGHHTRERQPMFPWLQKVLLGRAVPHSWALGRRSDDTLHKSTSNQPVFTDILSLSAACLFIFLWGLSQSIRFHSDEVQFISVFLLWDMLSDAKPQSTSPSRRSQRPSAVLPKVSGFHISHFRVGSTLS